MCVALGRDPLPPPPPQKLRGGRGEKTRVRLDSGRNAGIRRLDANREGNLLVSDGS